MSQKVFAIALAMPVCHMIAHDMLECMFLLIDKHNLNDLYSTGSGKRYSLLVQDLSAPPLRELKVHLYWDFSARHKIELEISC